MLDSEDSEEGNSYKMFIKSPTRNRCPGSEFKLGCVSSTETSQEELSVASWSELSIIERVGLNRWRGGIFICHTGCHGAFKYSDLIWLFIKLSVVLFSDSVEMSEKDLEVSSPTPRSPWYTTDYITAVLHIFYVCIICSWLFVFK